MILALTLALAVGIPSHPTTTPHVLVAKVAKARAKKTKTAAPAPEPEVAAPAPAPAAPVKPAGPPVNPDEVLATWTARRGANPSYPELEALVKKMDQAILDFKGLPTQKTVALHTARVQAMVAAMTVAGKRADEDPYKNFRVEHDRWLTACTSGLWTVSQRGWAVVDDLRSRGLDAESLAAEVSNPRCRARKTARYDSDLFGDLNASKEYLKRYPNGAHVAQALEPFAGSESDRVALTKALIRDEDSSFEDGAEVVDAWSGVVSATAASDAKTKALESLKDLRKKIEVRAKEVSQEK